MGNLSELELVRRVITALQQGASILSEAIHASKEFEGAKINVHELIPNVHVFSQTASNTACGWGGIAGQAFTSFYLVVLEYRELDLAVIFVDRPAYVCHVETCFRKLLDAEKLPLWNEVSDGKLHVLWKASK